MSSKSSRERRGVPFGAVSARQLVFLIDRLSQDVEVPTVLADQVRYAEQNGHNPDDFIRSFLRFLRSGLGFEAPRWLRAANALQQEVIPKRFGFLPGDYESYIGRLENLFLPYPMAALDEYGVPVEMIRKLSPHLRDAEEIDPLLNLFTALDPSTLNLSRFEELVLRSAQVDLGQSQPGPA